MTSDEPLAHAQAPWAVSPQGDPHSQRIEGKTPHWQRNTLRDKGRKKVDCRRRGYVESYGLKGYYHEPCDEGLPGRRQFESLDATKSINGPAIVGGHNTYYLRRSGTSDQGEFGYRRCRRATSPPSLKDRFEKLRRNYVCSGLNEWQRLVPRQRFDLRRRQDQNCSITPSFKGQKAVQTSNNFGSTFTRKKLSLRVVPIGCAVDRPDRRRFIKTPQKSPPASAERPREPQPPPTQEQVGPEVTMPRLGHPNGWNCLRESDREMEFERVLGRKVRIDYNSLKSTGYAGDLTNTYGAAKRTEDDPTFFRKTVESPTFIRFMTHLPANSETSPHKQRDIWFRQREASQRMEDAKLVESLGMWGDDEQENTAKG